MPHAPHHRRATRSRALLAAFALSASALVATTSAAAAPSPDGVEAPELVGENDRVTYDVRPVGVDATTLAEALLADGFDVYSGGHGVLFVHGTSSDGPALRARADLDVVAVTPVVLVDAPAPASQDDVLPSRLDGKAYETYYGGYRTADAFVEFTDDLEDAYPEIVEVITYGESYTGDNDLRVVCVTADVADSCELTPDVDKARYLFVAQTHSRELSTSEMAWRLLALLTDEYGKDADITALLAETEFWIVPQVNPDGIEHVEDGFQGEGGYTFQRKNMHQEQACGHIGTDLNRNFDSSWGGAGTSGEPCSEVYRGTSAASEPETFEVQDLMKAIFEDQRGSGAEDPAPDDTRGGLVSLHTSGNLLLFPYGNSRLAPNDAGLRSMGFRYSHYNGYETGKPNEILYQVTGSTDDYAYDKLGIPGVTFEIGTTGFHPPYSQQDGFWELNREAFLYGARLVQQPYVMGLGPTVLEAKAKNKGGKAVVTATADDDAYGNDGVGRPASQDVTAGRVFVGTAPWDGGTPKKTKIVGSGKEVGLKVKLKRGADDQLVWVQAKDASGNWGPTRAVWLRGK